MTSGMCLAILALVSSLLPGGASAQITVKDDRGATIEWSASPRRIVSLLPSLTESVCALGACSRLVGVDRYSNWPAGVVSLPRLGGLEDAQVERIVALRPDVVLASSAARIVDRLESLGQKVVVLESRNHDDVRRSLMTLARLLEAPAEGDRVWAGIEEQTRAAAARVPSALRGQSVYFEVDAAPYAAGAGSFIGETLARLGLPNAVPAELGAFPRLNPEYVIRLQPDIVMAASPSLAGMPARPGWSALLALRDRRTCGFASDRYELLIRPGPRMGEAAQAIADCLVAMADRAGVARPAR